MFSIVYYKQRSNFILFKMMLYLFLCNIFFNLLAVGSNTTLHKLETISNKTLPLIESPKEINTSKLTLVSEGGSLLPDTPALTLPKGNLTSLMTLEEDMNKVKEKPVVARKGVDNLLEDIVPQLNSPQVNHNSSNENVEMMNKQMKTTIASANSKNNKSTIKAVNSVSLNKTEIPKKPLVLSYEALSKMDKGSENVPSKIPAMESSSKTLVNDQMPSPNKDKSTKIYPTKANSHPGMIMPIVITILVVPMFAIIGYMALRRGREAWKNRHYKRMDFLLDGMYND